MDAQVRCNDFPEEVVPQGGCTGFIAKDAAATYGFGLVSEKGWAMQRWSDVSREPNSHEAKAFRLETLRRARRRPVIDRIAYLQSLTRGQRVLDVGVVAHTAESETHEEWLHRAIASVARYCLGVDILPEEVKKLQTAGYNVRCCDITREELGEEFQVITVGEVIEHLGCPEHLFAAAKRLLLPGGRLVMTTPNAYYWKQIRNHMGLRKERCESVDHVTFLFPSGMAELAERSGLVLETYRGVYVHKPRRLGSRLAMPFKRLAGATVVAPEIFCETMIYEFVTPGVKQA